MTVVFLFVCFTREFGKPEERKYLPLETFTGGLVKTQMR
jgi:hypothetical protein